jgi:hypothetical protein
LCSILIRISDISLVRHAHIFDFPQRTPGDAQAGVAGGTLNGEDRVLTWNMPLDGGGLLVSGKIRPEIEAEAVLQP